MVRVWWGCCRTNLQSLTYFYWMLECGRCKSRRVVRDFYLERVETGGGPRFGGRPLPERYGCLNRCPGSPRLIGSVFEPTDAIMWAHDPFEPVKMTRRQSEEWEALANEAGVLEDASIMGLGRTLEPTKRRWWRFWR